jgi:hypothetical protein
MHLRLPGNKSNCFPAPRIKAHPYETFVAEKLQAIVALGIVNSRMKDYYDLWITSKQFPFDGEIIVRAIKATFECRKTARPSDTLPALTDEFARNSDKITQWKAFLKRNELEDTVELSKVVQDLQNFILPPLLSATNDILNKSWPVGGPWS